MTLNRIVKSLPMTAYFQQSPQRLAVGDIDGKIVVLDIQRPEKDGCVLEVHSGAILAVAFSTDGKMIASFSQRGQTLRVFQVSLDVLCPMRSRSRANVDLEKAPFQQCTSQSTVSAQLTHSAHSSWRPRACSACLVAPAGPAFRLNFGSMTQPSGARLPASCCAQSL
jgi:WD40 repeat protein